MLVSSVVNSYFKFVVRSNHPAGNFPSFIPPSFLPYPLPPPGELEDPLPSSSKTQIMKVCEKNTSSPLSFLPPLHFL